MNDDAVDVESVAPPMSWIRRQAWWPVYCILVASLIGFSFFVWLIETAKSDEKQARSERLAVVEVEICEVFAERYRTQSPEAAEDYLYFDFGSSEERFVAKQLLDPRNAQECLEATASEADAPS